MEDNLNYRCPLCGANFFRDESSCARACPFSDHCNVVCCPHCGYSFPKDSRIVQFFKKLFKKRGKDGL